MRQVWDWGYVAEVLPLLLRGLLVTFQLTVLSLVIALTLGLLLAVLRLSSQAWISLPAKWFIEFVRSTPLLVQLYFLYYVGPSFGLVMSPFLTGVIGLGVHFSTFTAEVYRAGIQNVPSGQWEAARSLNLSTYWTWRSIVLPQAIASVIPALGNYCLSMFKETPVLIGISVVEMLGEAQRAASQTYQYLEPLTLAGALFFIVSYPLSKVLRWLETVTKSHFGARQ
ncbi:MAG: ectoine/hydroxyectoine ABC transporter permease subunit EhuD [Rhizobiaceae bacterium]|nr:ectoine/hydroxyectoine ABC transporter permease subunit EhuD [Rhizobiaceae bacterium]